MKPNAIVYTSNTGYTRQYAKLLGDKTGLPVYFLDEAGAKLPPTTSVLYLGWLMAGKVQGYAKAAGKGLADKKDRTPEEDAMLDMMLHGGSRVSEENLADILAWYEKE